jgi:multiple sugar transport system substrate-binding protein
VDTRQIYQAEFNSWAWKGKQWGIPFASGGEVVPYNKRLFDQKGVKYPAKDWTYDDFLDTCRRLNDPANNRWAVTLVENGLYYIGATFAYNFGGKVMSDAKDRAVYADDPKSIQGTQLNVDLHTKYGYAPPAAALATLPAGKRPIEVEMAAMEISGNFRHTNIRAAIGEALDYAPPPRGPAAQTAAMAGNAWSIMSTSRVKDAAWKVLKWVELTKEGMLSPQIKAIAWPPLIAAADAPEWKDQFKGTRMAEAAKVWETGGRAILVTPDAGDLWGLMDAGTPPLNKAFLGEQSVVDAMRESARQVNEVIARRPPEWR